MSAAARMNRLFGPSGRCFQIALDHGVHNEWRFLPGVENMQRVVETVIEANPDAVLLAPGQAMFLQQAPGRMKPALALRTDPTNFYGPASPHYFCQMIDSAVEQALRLDAACVVVNLLYTPDEAELYHQCLRNVCALKAQCERYAMPLMVEPLGYRKTPEGYTADRRLATVAALVRQAVELGADIVKADPTDSLDEYERVIEVASGRPVLPRGGERVSDEEVLSRTRALLRAGARGVVYGRNVFQHPNPARIAAAIHAMIHQGREIQEAMQELV